jgi:hypothetical protein
LINEKDNSERDKIINREEKNLNFSKYANKDITLKDLNLINISKLDSKIGTWLMHYKSAQQVHSPPHMRPHPHVRGRSTQVVHLL